jgi:hypothetical protein
MAYQIHFSTQEDTIHLRLTGDVAATDIFNYNQDIVALLRQNPTRKLHLLIDASGMTNFPSNLQEVRFVLTYTAEPNLGWVIDYGNKVNNFYFVNGVLNQLAGVSYSSVLTFREARDRIDFARRKFDDHSREMMLVHSFGM